MGREILTKSPMNHFADRLAESVRRKNTALCVGLDPRWDSLPGEIRRYYGSDSLEELAAGGEAFCLRVLDQVAPHAAAVKPQSAFFEAFGPPGLTILQTVITKARELGL